MKALFSLLTSVIVLTQVAFAQSEGYVGRFEFPVGTSFFPVSYVYDLTDVNACEALVQKEIFRVCIVRDKRAADATFEMTYQTPPAVSIDAAGQLVLGENAASAKWLTLNWTEIKDGVAIPITADYITVGDQAGVPKQFLYTNASGQSYYGFDVSTTEDLPAGTGKVYVYLVAMDTRMGTGACEGQPYHVKAYAMALCPKTATTPDMSFSTSRRAWLVGGVASTSVTVYWPGYGIAWQNATPIQSLVVTQDDTQVTLTGEALATYLKPEIATFAQGTDDEGNKVLTLSATGPDVQYYTLYTKAALSDSEWTRFSDFVENEEKVLDKSIGKQYTRFRIDGRSLSIPVISGENTRFYQLRGE